MRLRSDDCPSDSALSRAFTVGAPPPLQAHIEGCARCLAAWRGFEELRLVARDMPVARLPESSRQRVREALLAPSSRVARPPRWRWPVVVGLTAGAVAALVILVVRRPTEEPGASADRERPARNGQVTAIGQARYHVLSERPDEVVRLEEGTISVEVNRLPPGERFRVRTGDGEVEVRGTAFEVRAANDHLTAVQVHHGQVEVRAAGVTGTIAAGESWSAGASTIAKVQQSEPRPATVPLPRPSRRAVAPTPPPASRPASHVASIETPPPKAAPTSPAEDHFREAWAALKAGDAGRAQSELDRAQAAPGAAAIIEDIRFWRGVVLQKRGRHEEARRAFEEFLARHADSARAGEASVALGWSLLATHEEAAARGRFQSALHDRSARVRESARAGLVAAASDPGGATEP